MKYPIGIQDFQKIRKEGYAYVDKTRLVYKMADEGAYYFLSRPRRFGKSLLVSTLENYFMGNKELFEGLAIYDLEKDWHSYPVFHIDLNTADFMEKGSLHALLNDYLCTWENSYGARESETTLALRFKGVIERAAKKEGRNVVVLIDEYDKPVLQTLRNDTLRNEYRDELKAFYSVLKTQDRYIKFADNSYQVAGNAELYFQNALYLIFKIMGFYTQVELPTSDGGIDVIIQTPKYVYIIECKLDESADDALQQIEAKGYAAPFGMDKRQVVKLGINFSSDTRGVESYRVKTG